MPSANRSPVLMAGVPPDANGANHLTIRAHLALIAASPQFETSKRSRDLLTHLVEKTLAGQVEDLKERSLGEDVFGRPAYEPSEENLVRVAVSDLRKRLSQYYNQHPDASVRIDLPRGRYVPVFDLQPLPSVEPIPATTSRRGTWAWKRWILPAAIIVTTALSVWAWASRSSPEEAFWKPVLAAGKPAVIWFSGSAGIISPPVQAEILKHEHDSEPYTLQVRPDDLFQVDQFVAYGHVQGIATLSAWLAAHGQTPQVSLGLWNTPSGLGGRPLILFGARNNPWTVELTKDLRFRVEGTKSGSVITDKNDANRRWSIPDYRKSGFDVHVDYGLVTRVIDPASGQVRLSIGGIAHYSSQAAAEFLTTPKYWSNMSQVAPKGWEHMNMQVVLEVKVTEKVPQSPKPVAWHFW